MDKKVVAVKPPYAAALFGAGRRPSSEAELRLLAEIDNLMLTVRQIELSGDPINIFETLQEHANDAYEYYSNFNRSDMLKLELASMIAREAMEDLDE